MQQHEDDEMKGEKITLTEHRRDTSNLLELSYSSHVEHGWSKKNSYSNVASVKKLNNEELSKQSGTRNNVPSLVARLMGIDMMPLDTKSVVTLNESTSENLERKLSKKGMNERGTVTGSSNFNSSSQKEFDSFHQDIDDDGWEQNFGKPRPKEHPQEEELQKFKKEFEAYQATMFKECSKVVEIESVSRRMLAQENRNKGKVPNNASSQREAAEKSAELDSHSFKPKLPNDVVNLVMEPISTKQRESFPSRRRTLSRDFKESSMMKSRRRLDICSSSTQIVILKPGPDRICNCNLKEDWISSTGTLQGRNSIGDFLEEVGERLKRELQGKTLKKGSVVQASGIETLHNEKPSDPTGIAHHIAKEVIDAEGNLLRSESTRSHNSEIQFYGSSSPQFFNRETRRFLSERLRNIKKSEAHFDIPEATCGNSRPYMIDNNRVRLKQEEDTTNCANDMSHWEILKVKKEIQTGSFRHEPDDNVLLHKELSPRNLVRSLSAPVSGTSFGNLLLEDSHILTGVRIQRKLEAVETMPVNENFTEVPPSPVSVCTCAQESPISTPDVSSTEGIAMPKVFRDISSGLNELRRQLSQLDSDCPEDLTTKQEPVESELVQMEDPAESYIRDLLVASGLYFGSWDKSLLIGDTLAKPIGNSVFEEVEESHKELVKENERSIKDPYENKLEHKILLDLLNEALSIVLGPPLTFSAFRNKLSNSSMQPPPCGKELLKLVWDIIHVSLYPPSNTTPYSLDSLVAQDLGSMSWSGPINDQINILQREIAYLIIGDLVEEVAKDMLLGVV
ncbi:uncharacterized protein LOC133296458 [Gastrolobium bilobum]|uniref:uncharacterized protein LOC133296458 n=1 Tax=Gastrolobium bilobum TaxID=150636 RepID=UPI002AB24953|nr:uncharacterized protein LOC133296458 [Gastrolobium bilobum]